MRIELIKKLDGLWDFRSNQKQKKCCDSMNDFQTDAYGYITSRTKDDFHFSVDSDHGTLYLCAGDPFYYLTDIEFCPYCGTPLSISRKELQK